MVDDPRRRRRSPERRHAARRHPPCAADRSSASRTTPSPHPQALVTAETESQLVVLDPATARVEKRIAVPADPEFVAASRSRAVVVSPGAGAVTVLRRPSLGRIRILRGFGSPHIAEIAPDGRFAYVTDDARGEVAVIAPSDGRLVDRIAVGPGAHHLTFRPDGARVWLALGESARTIVVLDSSDLAHPRVIARFDPGFSAHDLRFTPDGRRVWITSDATSEVGVFNAHTQRLLFSVPGGAPPQHVAFAGQRAYLTSGYGGRIELVSTATGRVLRIAPAPFGSFDLDTAAGLVATSSLLRGTLAVYDQRLRHLRVTPIAPAARDVALSVGGPDAD